MLDCKHEWELTLTSSFSNIHITTTTKYFHCPLCRSDRIDKTERKTKKIKSKIKDMKGICQQCHVPYGDGSCLNCFDHNWINTPG